MLTQEEISKKYSEAPPDVQALVKDPDVYDAFHLIRRTHNLHVDAAGALADLITALILGAVPLAELDAHLAEALPGVDAATREKVRADLNEHIFKPLRERKRSETPDLATVYKAALIEKLGGTLPRIEESPAKTVPSVQVPRESIVAQKLGVSPRALQTREGDGAPQPRSGAQEPSPTSTPVRYRSIDPYREPIE
ncbi:hypothetical protein KGO06_02205 [Patescibacteria group bacterium]|nr:hypothetical protein [Patescibacteria group bacterium]